MLVVFRVVNWSRMKFVMKFRIYYELYTDLLHCPLRIPL
jgi:hypothetical protein